MKLIEHDGKMLLRNYGVTTPKFEIITSTTKKVALEYPIVLKSQVIASDRKIKGGIVIVKNSKELHGHISSLFSRQIDGIIPKFLLAEEFIEAGEEIYVSLSYSSDMRAPCLALNKNGGTGVNDAVLTPIDILRGCDEEYIYSALTSAKINASDSMVLLISNLWKLFVKEKLTLLEINPLFITPSGDIIAGDAKIICDDAFSSERPFVSLGGDIAVIASGGGASMLNIDILMRAGGRPANYVEYSGNPPRSVVEELTLQVLSQPGLRGAWIIGGTANFTDIYETMLGFVTGLKRLKEKPTYPIVIRRDGPRQQEAKIMIETIAKEDGYNMHVFGPECSMAESAQKLLKLMSGI